MMSAADSVWHWRAPPGQGARCTLPSELRGRSGPRAQRFEGAPLPLLASAPRQSSGFRRPAVASGKMSGSQSFGGRTALVGLRGRLALPSGACALQPLPSTQPSRRVRRLSKPVANTDPISCCRDREGRSTGGRVGARGGEVGLKRPTRSPGLPVICADVPEKLHKCLAAWRRACRLSVEPANHQRQLRLWASRTRAPQTPQGVCQRGPGGGGLFLELFGGLKGDLTQQGAVLGCPRRVLLVVL